MEIMKLIWMNMTTVYFGLLFWQNLFYFRKWNDVFEFLKHWILKILIFFISFLNFIGTFETSNDLVFFIFFINNHSTQTMQPNSTFVTRITTLLQIQLTCWTWSQFIFSSYLDSIIIIPFGLVEIITEYWGLEPTTDDGPSFDTSITSISTEDLPLI